MKVSELFESEALTRAVQMATGAGPGANHETVKFIDESFEWYHTSFDEQVDCTASLIDAYSAGTKLNLHSLHADPKELTSVKIPATPDPGVVSIISRIHAHFVPKPVFGFSNFDFELPLHKFWKVADVEDSYHSGISIYSVDDIEILVFSVHNYSAYFFKTAKDLKKIKAKYSGELNEENPDYVNFKGSSKKRELKKEMRREIERFKKMDHDDPKAYPDDWTADRKYKKELKAKGKELPKSKHTQKYHQMFGEETVLEGNVDTALKNKAEKSGISLSILRKVFNRGMAAWRTGHRPGVSQHQWAMARVNSFIVGGPARKADHDLWVKA